MRYLSQRLDRVSSALEAYGLYKLAFVLDTVANTIDTCAAVAQYGHTPVDHPDVISLPLSTAKRMLAYNRLGEHKDLTAEGWATLTKDIQENGIVHAAVAVQNSEGDTSLFSGNHRVPILEKLGRKTIPVIIIKGEHPEVPWKTLNVSQIM